MENELTPSSAATPHDILAAQGKSSGEKQLKEKGKEYFSEMGKRSAAKRKKDKRFGKKYYAALGKRSGKSKRAKKEGRELEPLVAAPNPLKTINDFLKGKI